MPVSIEANFAEDLRRHCVEWLTGTGFRLHVEPRTEVDASLAFFKAKQRLIAPKPRNVEWSNKLRVVPFSDQVRRDLDDVAGESQRGENLCRRLSRSIKDLGTKDGLLFDWGVHHLHLGHEVEGDGFVKRSGPVLLVLVRDETLYFVDVVPHGRDVPPPWGDRAILDAIDAEWPETIADWRFDDVELDDEDVVGTTPSTIMSMRRVGISILYKAASGRIYMSPGGGVTLGGGSGLASRQALSMCNRVDRFERAIRERGEDVAERFSVKAGRTLTELQLQLLVGSCFRVRELQTGVVLREGL